MNPTEIGTVLATLEPLLHTLSSIGLPGLIAIIFLAPISLIAIVLLFSYANTRRMERTMRESLEAYRKDNQETIHELATKHAEVVSFYHKNVDLVKNYERMTDVLQTLVVNNTRAVERLSAIIEHRGK